MSQDFRFIAQGREFDTRNVGGPGQACEVARAAARANPGVEHEVHADGKFFASYKLVGKRLIVRMP